MTWEEATKRNQRQARGMICHTCRMLYKGVCTMCADEFCDLEDYIPTTEFIKFMTTLADGSSDEAEGE